METLQCVMLSYTQCNYSCIYDGYAFAYGVALSKFSEDYD